MTGPEALDLLEARLRDLLADLRVQVMAGDGDYRRGFAAGVKHALDAIEVDLLGDAGKGGGE